MKMKLMKFRSYILIVLLILPFDASAQLFHPLNLVTYLFSKPEIIACQQVSPASYIIILRHPHIVGTLELSTAYTWTAAEEFIKICTSKGIYRLSQMEQLTFEPKPSTILGIPIEKEQNHRIPFCP